MVSFLDVDGLSIRYLSNLGDRKTQEGKRPTVVLFHGNAFSLDNWVSIGTLERLAKEGFDAVAIDLPSGRGSKSSKIEKKNIQDYVPILEKVFSKLQLDKNHVALIGPSMGGGFALAYAIAHPEAVSALVLISPSIRTIDQSHFSTLEMPVLLLWGDRDNVFPLEIYGRELKNQFPHAKLLILKGAGHASYLDKPEEFHEILLDFLNEVL